MNGNHPIGRAWRCSALGSCLLVWWGCDAHAPTQPRFSSRAASASSDVTVTSTSPNNAPQDTTLDVAVDGSGFDRGSVAQWARNGAPVSTVRTNSTRFVSPKQLIANITISLVADTGLYDVMVTASTGKKGIGTELFTIKPHGPKPPEPANPTIAYVAGSGLWVMNASGSNQTEVFAGVVEPTYPAWSPGGASIAFDYQGGFQLWRVDVTVSGGVPIGSNALALVDTTTGFPDWSPDGATIAVQGPAAGRPGENCCILLVPASGGSATVAYMAPVGRAVTFPAWSPDGAQIVFVDLPGHGAQGDCRVSIVTLATGAVRVLVPDGVFSCAYLPRDLEWSPDGREVALASLRKQAPQLKLFVVDVGTGAITDLGIYGRSPSFSPDGTRIVYESLQASGIYVLDRATGQTAQLTSSGGKPDWRK